MIKFIFIVLIGLPLFTCGDYDYDSDKAIWRIKNSTQRKVLIKSRAAVERYDTLAPGDSMILLYERFDYGSKRLRFEYFHRIDPMEDYIEVATEGQGAIKTWRESEKDDAGRQLFNEQYWRFRKYKPLEDTYFMWTFDILSEDIEPQL